jgi:hypothetical protein
MQINAPVDKKSMNQGMLKNNNQFKLGVLAKMIDSQHEEILLRKSSAQNLKTTVKDLQDLSNDVEAEVRKAATGNPNMPIEILLKLGKEFPDEVINNPIFMMMVLENPESRFIRLSIARSSTISAEACETFKKTGDYEILCAIGENPATPVNILEELIHHPPQLDEDDSSCDELFACIARNRNTPVELLIELYNYQSDYIKIGLAENPNTPVDFLHQFAIYRNPAVYRALLHNPNTSTSTLEILAEESQFDDIKIAVRNHPNMSRTVTQIADFIEGKPGVAVDVLEKLVHSKNTGTKILVAEHPRTSFSAFMKLIKDNDKNVRMSAVNNPLLPESVLEEFILKQLPQEYSEWGRYNSGNVWYSLTKTLVQQPDLNSELIGHLVDFLVEINYVQEPWLLAFLIDNQKILPDTLTKLVKYCVDDADKISRIIRNKNTPSEAIEIAIKKVSVSRNPNDFFIMKELLMHPNIPVEILVEFSDSQNRYFVNFSNSQEYIYKCICEGIAMNIKTPINILKKLAIHQDNDVKTAVGGNPNTPVSILSQLAADPCTRSNVATNINTPREILLKFIVDPELHIRMQIGKNNKAPSDILVTLANDHQARVREAVASNINIPVHTLQLLAQDSVKDVRNSLLDNPQLPDEILDLLVKDSSTHIKLSRYPSTSHDILMKLSESQDINVYLELVKRQDLSKEAIKNITELTFQKMDMKAWERRTHDQEKIIIFEIARHLNTPIEVLKSFAEVIIEIDKAYVLAIKGRPEFEILAKFEFWSSILPSLIENPNVSIDIIDKLVIHCSDPENKRMVIRKLRKM